MSQKRLSRSRKTSGAFIIFFKSKRTKQAVSIHLHLFILASSIDEICIFLLPYKIQHNICSIYTFVNIHLPKNDNSCFLKVDAVVFFIGIQTCYALNSLS